MKKLLFSSLLIFTSIQAYSQSNWYNVHMSFTNLASDFCSGMVSEIYFVDTTSGFTQTMVSPVDSSEFIYTDINGFVVDEFNSYVNNITINFHIPADTTVKILVALTGTGPGCDCMFDTLWCPTVSLGGSVQELLLDLYQWPGLWICPGHVNDFTMNTVKTYPNPASNTISVNSPLSSGFVKVYSESGVLVLHKRFFSQSFDLNISSLSKGSYFVELYYSDGTYTGRFIK